MDWLVIGISRGADCLCSRRVTPQSAHCAGGHVAASLLVLFIRVFLSRPRPGTVNLSPSCRAIAFSGAEIHTGRVGLEYSYRARSPRIDRPGAVLHSSTRPSGRGCTFPPQPVAWRLYSRGSGASVLTCLRPRVRLPCSVRPLPRRAPRRSFQPELRLSLTALWSER